MPGVLREYWNGGFTEYIECTFSDKGFKKKIEDHTSMLSKYASQTGKIFEKYFFVAEKNGMGKFFFWGK